ncbi:MAG: class II aldolase/adducin family protein [Actinomycetia bacterium]|nr:class II aldolase/adducin family protein [Actinomycetes bacterium]
MPGFAAGGAVAALVAVGRQLEAKGLLFRGTHANLSARIGPDRFVMTRGGSVAHLDAADFAVVGVDERVLEGDMDPTMHEVVAMHAGIYRVRPEAGAVIHTHSPHLTAFALAHEPLPAVYEPLLRFGLAEPVPVVPWAPRGSERSVGGIVDVVRDHPDLSAVLLANHGVLVFQRDPASTAQLLATLDEAAELVLLARALGGAKPLPPEALDAVRARMTAFGSRR